MFHQRDAKRNLFTLTKLYFTAYITIAAVLFAPNFCMIFFRWVLIVWGLKNKRSIKRTIGTTDLSMSSKSIADDASPTISISVSREKRLFNPNLVSEWLSAIRREIGEETVILFRPRLNSKDSRLADYGNKYFNEFAFLAFGMSLSYWRIVRSSKTKLYFNLKSLIQRGKSCLHLQQKLDRKLVWLH